MREVNQFDVAEISNLGIGFETKEEMQEFTAIVRHEFERRVGEEMERTMSPKQMNELECIMESDKDGFARWMNENCPQCGEICYKVKTELKKELLKYRDEIPGGSLTSLLRWNGMPIEECEGLTLREARLLKANNVDTLGELYALTCDELYEIFRMFEIPLSEFKRADQIKFELEQLMCLSGVMTCKA